MEEDLEQIHSQIIRADAERRWPEVARLYRVCAEQGEVHAQWYFGDLLEHGKGVPKDEEEAEFWYRKAAEQGDAHAQFALGFLYDRKEEPRKGVPRHATEAVKWYHMAAEQGSVMAQTALADIYYSGREGRLQDDQEAAFWYREAAEKGDNGAQLWLGRMYRDGRGVPQDFALAYMWLNLAAAASGGETAAEARDELAKKMPPTQIVEAQKMAREWNPSQ